jgi:hypothetical protein
MQATMDADMPRENAVMRQPVSPWLMRKALERNSSSLCAGLTH